MRKRCLIAMLCVLFCIAPLSAASTEITTTETTIESTSESTSEGTSESTSEGMSESTSESTSEGTTENTSASKTEAESTSEVSTEQTSEQTAQDIEQTTENTTENITESTTQAQPSAEDLERAALLQQAYDELQQQLAQGLSADEAVNKMEILGKQAQLLGDADLQAYAEYQAQMLALTKQIEELQALIDALKQGNSEIAGLDDVLQNSIQLDMTVDDVIAALPDGAATLLQGLPLADTDGFDVIWQQALQDIARESAGVSEEPAASPEISPQSAAMRSLSAVSAQTMRYIAVRMTQFAVDNELRSEQEAKPVLDTLVQGLSISDYAQKTLAAMREKANQFAASGKLTQAASATNFIVFDSEWRLQDTPIIYNQCFLISLDDIAQYLNAEVTVLPDNDVLVILSAAVRIEVQRGEAVAFANDERYALNAPVLWFDNHAYVSAEFFAQSFGKDYLALPAQNAVIIR